ncbi:MAG: hypothetical protein GY884_29565 [Proteobacteria bacterium]|nr:hypothetical protein [Pseudomonadota bacterium]
MLLQWARSVGQAVSGGKTWELGRLRSIRYRGHLRSIGKTLAGYWVGVEAFGENRFRVWFAEVLIGVGELPWTEPLRPPGRGQEQQPLEGE